jgi:predicted nucleotidyltransferase
MVRRIVKNFDPDKIILFGSYADGTADTHSDVDLLIVMPVTTSKRKQGVQIEMALADIALPKDVIVVTPEEVQKYRDVVGSIVYPALREGKILYERAA